MGIFSEEISIQSANTKETVISLLQKNIEPFHKDNSKLIFEGKIATDGIFNIKLSEIRNGGWTRFPILNINGLVEEADEQTYIVIMISIDRFFKNFILFMGIVMISLSIVLLLKDLDFNGFQWFSPLLFYFFTLIIAFFTIQSDKRKIVMTLRDILH